jgi:hypothetical protein
VTDRAGRRNRDNAAMQIELPERLTDGQVVVRPMRVEDAGPYANGFALDPDLGRMLGSETDPDETSVRDRIEGQARSAGDGKSFS